MNNENTNAYNVLKIDSKQYDSLTQSAFFYMRESFCELNKGKVDSVEYLTINKGNSNRFALCVGVKNGVAKCPFSAPYGLPIKIKKQLSISDYDYAIEALDAYAYENNWKGIYFTLPPVFYNEEEITAWVNVFYRHGYSFDNIDVNYAFDLKKIRDKGYESLLHHNAKKNLRIALESDLILKKCEKYEDIKLAYEVIAENRSSKGYPLRMSFEQVCETINIVDHDVYLLSVGEDSIAAALVYSVLPDIAQVIYWGDRPGYSEYKPINAMSYNLINIYEKRGYSTLDIGISTVDSIPNYGLCDFKESIGCDRGLKYIMRKEF